ncbi:hypothetical protein VB002_09415 [Campylobacter concisus]
MISTMTVNFSWSENLNPEHAGRIAWKAYLPNDGTVKVGDVMHYMWGEQVLLVS